MPGSIRLINVNGLSAIVDINTTGTPTEFTAYSDLACTQTVALPATITTDTTFYVKATGVVMLSVTVDGTELAGPARVTLSNAGPATFSLDTDPSNDKSGTLLGLVSTHSSGGSSADPTQFVALYSAAAVDPATWTGWDAVNDVNGAGFPAGWSVSGKNVAVPPGLYAVTMGADINGGTGVVTATITFNLAGGGNASPESSVTAATGFHAVGISATGWVGDVDPVYLSLNGPAAGNVTNAFPWALIVQLAKS